MSGNEQAEATWYQFEPKAITWAGLRREKSLATSLLIYPIKSIGVLTGADCEPAVDSTLPFLTPADAMPAEVLEEVRPEMDALAALGFALPVYHRFADPVNYATYTWATMRRNSGGILARATMFTHTQADKRFPQILLITKLLTGGFVVSSAGSERCEMPPGVTYRHERTADAATILAIHEQAVGTRPVCRLTTDELVAEATEELHRLVMAHNISLGLYILPRQVAPPPVEPYDHLLHTSAAKLLAPDKRRRWQANLKLLCITALMFVALLGPATDWMFALMILPVLFFHEAGHWIAMKAFGYGDVRMFFIPMFGAAVSGKKPRIAGWKPVVVYLAGPVPGILLAIPLAIIADRQQIDWLRFVAQITLFINLLNMLPVMPFDGGRVAHALLFQRHYMLDVLFRIFAGAVLIIIGGLATLVMLDAGAFITAINLLLPILGVVMLLGLPASWAVGRTVRAMRQTLRDDAFDVAGKPTPQLAYEVGLVHRDGARKKKTAKKALERLLTRSRETIDALGTRPIGIAGTLLLGGTYVGVFVAGAIVFMRPGFDHFPDDRWLPQTSFNVDEIQLIGGEASGPTEREHIWLIGTYESRDAAVIVFRAVESALPIDGRALIFGQTVIVELPRYEVDRDEVRALIKPIAMEYTESVGGVSMMIEFDADAVDVPLLQDEIGGYAAIRGFDLVAPWDPNANLTSDQIVARRTLGRIKTMPIDYWGNAEYQRRRDEYHAAKDFRTPAGQTAQSEVRKALDAAEKQLKLDTFTQLLAISDVPLNAELGRLYIDEPQHDDGKWWLVEDPKEQTAYMRELADRYGRRYHAWRLAIADQLGRHAFADCEYRFPYTPRDPYGMVEVDLIRPDGRYILAAGLLNPINGSVSAARWLSEKGARNLKYCFYTSPSPYLMRTSVEQPPPAEVSNDPALNSGDHGESHSSQGPTISDAHPAPKPLPASNIDNPRDVHAPVVPREVLPPVPPRSPGS